MPRLAAFFLFLFCGLMLLGTIMSLLTVATGRGSFGGGSPAEYFCLFVVELFTFYGFYAACRALFAWRRAPDPLMPSPSDPYRPGRRVGWGLIILGALGVYGVMPLMIQTFRTVLEKPQPLSYLLFGFSPILCLMAGGALLYAFRPRVVKA